MPYDPELAGLIRESLAHLPDVREVKMFGGLSFLVRDKMVASASSQGDLLIHCDPAATDELLKRPGASIARMGRRTMSTGWLRVTRETVRNPDILAFWIGAALDRNASETPGSAA